MQTANLNLVYTLLCDDVRIEMGNKISLMGIFQNIMVDKLPVSLIKFAVINHWEGQGNQEPRFAGLPRVKSNSAAHFKPPPIDLAKAGFPTMVRFLFIW